MGCIGAIMLVVAAISGLAVAEGMPIRDVPVLVVAAAWVIGSLCFAVFATAMDGAARKPATLRRLLRNWLIIVSAVVWMPISAPFGWLWRSMRARARAERERTESQEDWSSRRTQF